MVQEWWPALCLYLPASAIAAITGVTAWRFRRLTHTATALAFAMATITVWGVLTALGDFFPRYQETLLAFVVPTAALSVVGFLAVAQTTARRGWRPDLRWILLVGAEPLLVLGAAITNSQHGGLITIDETGRHWNALFWAHTGYCYVALTVGAVILFRARRRAVDLYARQINAMLLACGASTLGNVAAIWAQQTGHLYDFTMLGFAVTGVWDTWAIIRHGLFRLVPVARDIVIDTLTDAVLVVDAERRLIDVNAAGARMLRAALPDAPPHLIGLDTGRAMRELLGVDRLTTGEYRLEIAGRPADIDVRVSPLTGARFGADFGRVVVIRDITDGNQRRRELHDANERLVEQLGLIEGLRAELFEQATKDVLTGLHNRRYLMEVMSREVPRAVGACAPLGVLLLDLDHFKRINDRFGHAVGDRLLTCTGELLRASLPEAATVARYGGEEFVVVLPGAGLAEACEVAEALRRRFAEVTVPGREGAVGTTMSIGVADVRPTDDVDVLLERADQALYAAKAAGRDRVVAAGHVMDTASSGPAGPR